MVCGDTGITHLATALRTPSVVLFGPAPPWLWGPPADRRWHRTLRGSNGSPDLDPGPERLLRITVDDVLESLVDLPEPGGAPGCVEAQRAV
ncbi:MAG: hypothetical protein H0W21_14260 [Actinobacteria bacterium]|nr:hypothetical protein [Actinomycetota bacterium]